MTVPQHWRELPNAPAPGSPVCPLDTLSDGDCRLLRVGTPPNACELIVLRSGDTVLAYLNRCPHFGVPLAARQAQLIHTPHQSISCNVHYSRFRWADGFCEQGDCRGDYLLSVPLEVADGVVRIAV